MKSYVVLLFSSVFLISCFSEAGETAVAEPRFTDVDSALWEYFERFEQEARTRGISYDLNDLGISGVIEQIPESGVAGTCQYGRHVHHVTIDQNFWNRSSLLEREFVVFHELGHCVLNRGHDESAFNNGVCRSIMRSGLEDCRDAYSQSYREYYLDELFDVLD